MAVLYSLKGKKIYKPDFPTEGLVCYLNTEGKTNSDIHKAKLLDLSGNGNDGILTGFDFTETSGYVKDLSGEGASGLKFDGVDDRIQLNLTLADYTIIADATMPFMENSNNILLETYGLTLHLNSTDKNLYASILNPDGTWAYQLVTHERVEKICIKVSGEIIEIKTNNRIINKNIKNGSTFLRIGRGQVNFRKCLIYNRALTDTEITKIMEA